MSAVTVLVNKRKTFERAFTDPAMVMYLPVGKNGEVVCASQAEFLEAWVPNFNSVLKEIPPELARNDLPISQALLKRQGDDEVYGMLTTNVAFRGIKVMNAWLHCLQRDPERDVRGITTYATA